VRRPVTAGAPPSTPAKRPRSVWRDTLDDPATRAIALYALVAIAAAIAAYMAIFTQFARYDDEGTLLVTLKAFAHGSPLYRDVYSPYGPFYYELFGGLFALTGHAVTTDASRSVVIVLWVGTSLLIGLATQKLTGRLALGVAGMIVSFSVLYALIAEPMHPQGLCVLLLAAFTLLVVSGPTRRVGLAGAIAGALVAALILTKINLGAYLLAATALAAVLTVEPLYRRRWLRWPVILAFLAMPLVVMGRDLSADWVRSLLVIELAGASAVVIASWPARPWQGEDQAGLHRWLVAAAAGLVLAAAAIFAAIFATGSTPADVYDGMIGQALQVRDALIFPFTSPAAAIDWGVAAVAAATLTAWLRSGDGGRASIWPGLLRAVAGLAIWFTVARSAPFGLSPSANQDVLPLLLAWVAAVPPAGAPEAPYRRFVRVLLPAVAVAETLQVYPVAGAQIGIAAFAFVPVGALCLADALTSLRTWSADRGGLTATRFKGAATVASIALAAMLALNHIVLPAATNAVIYHHQTALPFAGAGLVRVPPAQAAEYEGVVGLIEKNRCTALIGYPNVDSIYLWSSLEPPKPSAPGTWITALEDKPQNRILRQLRASPRPCAIRSETLANNWLAGKPRRETPLYHYIFDDLQPVADIGEFEFLLPQGTAVRGVPK
jgi:hypothetical protein